jgi:hypothetical protein
VSSAAHDCLFSVRRTVNDSQEVDADATLFSWDFSVFNAPAAEQLEKTMEMFRYFECLTQFGILEASFRDFLGKLCSSYQSELGDFGSARISDFVLNRQSVSQFHARIRRHAGDVCHADDDEHAPISATHRCVCSDGGELVPRLWASWTHQCLLDCDEFADRH